jgi:precorrin-6B methylase 2
MKSKWNFNRITGSLLAAVAICMWGWGSPLYSFSSDRIILDVPYVPTRQKVVDEMLKMAQVGPSDVLYDLGSGDGRIVITAAKEFGARGVGVDLDPNRILESNRNASQAGVTDRVRFIEGDLFEADISEATVVTLYLLRGVNLKLRPKLLRELRPGTRIVSHNYDMEKWAPDQEVSVGSHDVYYWVVPSNVSGQWKSTPSGRGKSTPSGRGESTPSGKDGEEQYTLSVEQTFQNFQGTLTRGGVTMPIKDGKVTGDRISFTVEEKENGERRNLEFTGLARGHSMEGTWYSGEQKGEQARSWRVEREPSSLTEIDRSTRQISAPDEEPGRFMRIMSQWP